MNHPRKVVSAYREDVLQKRELWYKITKVFHGWQNHQEMRWMTQSSMMNMTPSKTPGQEADLGSGSSLRCTRSVQDCINQDWKEPVDET